MIEPNGLIVDLLVDASLLLLKLLSIWGLFFFAVGFARSAGLMAFHRGPAVTISPIGISNFRIRSVEIPWKSILSITPLRQVGTIYLLLTVEPAVFESVVSKEVWLSKLHRWLTFCRLSEGDTTIHISPENLQIMDDEFLSLVSAYAQAYGRKTE